MHPQERKHVYAESMVSCVSLTLCVVNAMEPEWYKYMLLSSFVWLYYYNNITDTCLPIVGVYYYC